MRLLTGEVAPLAPLLIPFAEVLGYLVAIGLIALVVALVAALVYVIDKTVGQLPLVGRFIGAGAHDLQRQVTSKLGAWAFTLDAKMGAALHQIARIIDWIGEEINRHANLIELLAGLLAGSAGIALVQQAIAQLLRHLHGVEKIAHKALQTTIALPRTVGRNVRSDVLPRVKSLEREIGGIIAHDLPGIRAADRTIWRGIDDLRKWVRTHALTAGTLAFTAAVAWALARLGGGWIRCRNWNRIGKHVCGLPANLIEDVLGLSLALLAVVDPVVIAEAAIKTEDTIGGIVEKVATLHDSAG